MLETVMGGDRPHILFEAGKMSSFGQIGRRTNFRSSAITDAIMKAVAAMQRGGKPHNGRTALPDGTAVYYQGVPIFGPGSEVYGAQVWLGLRDDVVTAPRNVEGYLFDLDTGLTTHGPGVDENILSIESVDTTRPSHDRIFPFYDNFPRLNDLGLYIKDIENGLREPTPFQAEISLTDGRGIPRNIHVSQVNRCNARGKSELRGLLHEVTDVSPHTTNYGLAMAKSLAARDDPGIGRALIELTTGIILDWINPPQGPLSPWAREIALFNNRGQQQAAALRQRVLTDFSLKYVEKPTQIRFQTSAEGEWHEVIVGYEHHGQNQGFMTVREARNPLKHL